MTITEVQALLARVQQVAGDVPVILKDIETGCITGLVSVGIELAADAASAVNQVTISHGTTAPASEPATPAPVTAVDG
jgi:hypothetical protein